MKLPKFDLPIYEMTVPSTGKKLKFRPFLVKEQKLLMMALETSNKQDILNAIKQCVENCVQTRGFKIENFASFDLEYFFIQLRAKSVGEVLRTRYTCENIVQKEDGMKPCGHVMSVEINLMDVKVDGDVNNSKKIMFTESTGVMMKYPSINVAEILLNSKNGIDFAFDFMVDCIDYIFDKDNIYPAKDIDRAELKEYLENLEQRNFRKIEEFFETLPQIKNTVNSTCPKCGYEHNIVVEGLQSFFD